MSELQAKGPGEKYCHECGSVIRARAEICPSCGVRQPHVEGMPSTSVGLVEGNPRTKTVAALLALFLGGIGLHKFYLGKPIWGVIYILFCWTFIPAIISLIEALNFLLMGKKTFQSRYAGPAWSS